MGKKYLETKNNSLESSVLGVWKSAIEEGDARDTAVMDGRTKAYKSHRAKLETARARRESKNTVREEYIDAASVEEIEEEIEELNTLIEELDEGIFKNIAKAAGKTAGRAAAGVAKKAGSAIKKKAVASKAGQAVIKAKGKVKAGVAKAKVGVAKAKAGAKKAKAIGGKIKKAAQTGTAYQAQEYDPMIEELEIIESKLNNYYEILEEVELDEIAIEELQELYFEDTLYEWVFDLDDKDFNV